MRAPRKNARGVTLLEAMIAGLVLTIGLTGLFGLIGEIAGANRHLGFKASSLDAYSQIAAQIRDAQCDFPAGTPSNVGGANVIVDPGLAAAVGVNWLGAVNVPVVGSSITTVGDFPISNPPLRVDYVAQDVSGTTGVPTLLVQVRVREITFDPVKDNAALVDGMWIRVFPIEKICSPRALPLADFASNLNLRGEY